MTYYNILKKYRGLPKTIKNEDENTTEIGRKKEKGQKIYKVQMDGTDGRSPKPSIFR